MRLNSLNRDMFKPFRSHNGLLGWVFRRVLEEFHRFLRGFLQRDASMRALWSDRQNCSHNVSQKVKRIRRLSDLSLLGSHPRYGWGLSGTKSRTTPSEQILEFLSSVRLEVPNQKTFGNFPGKGFLSVAKKGYQGPLLKEWKGYEGHAQY